jgi:hypothetical protein
MVVVPAVVIKVLPCLLSSGSRPDCAVAGVQVKMCCKGVKEGDERNYKGSDG